MSEGIWGHSSVIGGEQYVIATPDNGPDGVRAVQDWFAANVPVKNGATGYKLLYGYWKGEREQPMIFNYRHLGDLMPFFKNQECLLFLGPCDTLDRRPAFFASPSTYDGVHGFHMTYAGKFTEVSEEQAKASDCFTFDPAKGRYYLCIKEA